MIEIYYIEQKLIKGDINKLDEYMGKKLWINSYNLTKPESELLKEKFNLHPLTAEDLLNSPVRVKVEEFSDYLFSVFYGIDKKKNKRLELIEIDFVLGVDFLITNFKKETKSIKEFKNDSDRVERNMKKGLDFLFHKILDIEVDNFMPALESIDDDIEEIEEHATTNPKPTLLNEILSLKRHIVQIKKVTMPQREKIGFIAKNDYKLITKKAVPYFRDVYDHAIRVSDTIDNYREAIGNAFDAYMSAVSNNMNDVMKTLSIIATIALPLTAISGIYGTNFEILPGSTYAYGFWAMIIFMIILSFGMIFYFWKRKWI